MSIWCTGKLGYTGLIVVYRFFLSLEPFPHLNTVLIPIENQQLVNNMNLINK